MQNAALLWGGVKTVDQAKAIISLGVEKVAISSAAIEDPNFVRRLSCELCQSNGVVLDVKRDLLGRYKIFSRNGKHPTNLDPLTSY